MSFWDKARVAELCEKWNSDWSASQIADLWGLTRSAIVGKVYRLRNKGVQLRAEHDLDQRRRVSLQHVRQKAARAARRPVKHVSRGSRGSPFLSQLMAEAKASAPLKPNPADVPRKTLLELADTGECKFPITTADGVHMFCADKQVAGAPYCEMHCRRAFTPLQAPTGRGFRLPPLGAGPGVRVRETVG